MVFVRTKNIKGKKYAYLVSNSWEKGKVKQKVHKYLGPIFVLEKQGAQEFLELQKENSKDVIIELICRELLFQDFIESSSLVFTKGDIVVNINTCSIKKNLMSCVLEINSKYLYSDNLKDLSNYYEPETSDCQPGKKLAKLLMSSGLSITPDEFVRVYRLLYLEKNQ
jgi:hypothetical protein